MTTNTSDVERPHHDRSEADRLGEENPGDAVLGGESGAQHDPILNDALEPFDADVEDEDTI